MIFYIVLYALRSCAYKLLSHGHSRIPSQCGRAVIGPPLQDLWTTCVHNAYVECTNRNTHGAHIYTLDGGGVTAVIPVSSSHAHPDVLRTVKTFFFCLSYPGPPRSGDGFFSHLFIFIRLSHPRALVPAPPSHPLVPSLCEFTSSIVALITIIGNNNSARRIHNHT